MKKITFFELLADSDTTEGRGASIVVARFANQADAVAVNNDPRYYQKYGVMGTPYDAKWNVKETTLAILDSADEFFHGDLEIFRLQQGALAKLTDEEKEALGLVKKLA